MPFKRITYASAIDALDALLKSLAALNTLKEFRFL